jgi:hypothetical protein
LRPRKKIASQVLIGQRGINLVERRVLEMGCSWTAAGQVEAGIDGFIELRDPATGELSGGQIFVQSKATTLPFQGETDEHFEFLCDERDLEYWLSGTAPVILVCSQPDRDRAYWIPVKEHFADPVRRQKRKALFNKDTDRLDRDALPALLRLGVRPEAGVYLDPPPRPEELLSNLLTIEQMPEQVVMAPALLSRPGEVAAALREFGGPRQTQWILTNQRLLAFHDLHQPQWAEVCDQGAVDTFALPEWATSDDPQRQRELEDLLRQVLRVTLAGFGVRYDRDLRLYFFRATSNLRPRRVQYRSEQKWARRTVFEGHPSKSDRQRIAFYRHSALRARFRRLDERWLLQLSPDYHFTSDGERSHPYREEYLSGIKRLEQESAVRGQVVMWADLLGRGTSGFLDAGLRFGQLLRFTAVAGVPDELWAGSDEPVVGAGKVAPEDLLLFEEGDL